VINRVEFQYVTYIGIGLSQGSRWELNNAFGTEAQSRDPKWRKPMVDLDNLPTRIQIGHINRKTHSKCMNPIAGDNPEGASLSELLERTPDQAFCPLAKSPGHVCFRRQRNSTRFIQYNATIKKQKDLLCLGAASGPHT
jgi:hypothetical protein